MRAGIGWIVTVLVAVQDPATRPMKIQLEKPGAPYELVAVEALPIEDVEREPPPAAQPDGKRTYATRHGSTARDGRVHASLPDGTWSVRWQAELSGYQLPAYVLEAGERIVFDAPIGLVLDREGEELAQFLQHDRAHLDAANEAIYSTGRSGGLQVHTLSKGSLRFITSAGIGDHDTVRCAVRRKVGFLVVVSDTRYHPHGGPGPNHSTVTTFGTGKERTSGELLSTHEPGPQLHFDRTEILTAYRDDVLALATEGHLVFVDTAAGLEVTRVLSGDFRPLALSMDEAFRAHMIVATEDASELWVITRSGERVVRTALEGRVAPLQPPLVGFDHTVYVLERERVTAIDPRGAIAWSRAVEGAAGAVVTLQGLLVTEGAEVAAYGLKGERRLVARLDVDALITPPVVTTSGSLLVAGPPYLFALEPER